MKGKPELQTNDQIVRATAGPLSEAHVEILLELQELEPENGGKLKHILSHDDMLKHSTLGQTFFLFSFFFILRISRMVRETIYRKM